MPTEITPEQPGIAAFEAAYDFINAISDPVIACVHLDEDAVRCADTIRAALIALGWRAPGPATEVEVERAAEAYWTEVYGQHRRRLGQRGKWPEDVVGGSQALFRNGCRAALNAALCPNED